MHIATATETAIASQTHRRPRRRWISQVLRNYDLYLLMIPGLLFLIIFKFAPMYGLAIAFQNFNIFQGVGGSPWVGFAQFQRLFSSPDFLPVLRNTIVISLYKIIFLFPLPIIIALLLNEVLKMWIRRAVQTIIYLPHFLSWVVVAGLFVNILSPSTGIVNHLIMALGGRPISFLTDNHFFRGVLVATAGWKEVGWNTIIYLAAIAGLDPEMYEAARLDGASRFQQMVRITIPGILSTIALLFIIQLGGVLDAGTEQILLLYNPLVYPTGDVIGTYIYRVGLGTMDYSYAAAIGLFESFIGFVLVLSGNWIVKKISGKGIW
ncbi:MAG: ABC transporter permease subunit [Alicyclobacillus sp.]|nr:ABC transporter permease subunit [Alicyclobacillus sp.]